MKKFATVLILISCLSACYKDPFLNDEAFMTGKWKLVKIEISPFMLGGGTFPPEEQEIPFHFEFEVEKRGVWTEFLNGENINRFRVRSNSINLDRDSPEDSYIYVSFFEFNSANYMDNYEGRYHFDFNETQDTLTSVTYLPTRIYPQNNLEVSDPRPVFTFVKIQ